MMLQRSTAALSAAWRSGLETWKNGPPPDDWQQMQQVYIERWFRYTGKMFNEASTIGLDQQLYLNTKLLWKHIESIVDFYTGVVYQGALSTDGKPFPDGTALAIPIHPETPTQTLNDQLLTTCGVLWQVWNWQQMMSLRPMYAAALGDCLTELFDDTERRFVWPRIVWPGYVKEIILDDVGNIQKYTLEYRVQVKRADGTIIENYKHRKEVDKLTFKIYRDDKLTQTIPNVYGFVPAIWDRHRIAEPSSARGKSATDSTVQALNHVNSLFSHAFDFQHKSFSIPPMVASDRFRSTMDTNTVLENPLAVNTAELWRFRKVPADANLLQPVFDIGKTLEMIKVITERILSENPEASFYEQLREMQMITAPGAEMAMGDVKNRVDLVRAGADIQTVKLHQMAIAMCGFRANDTGPNGWSATGPLDTRRQAFLPYNLDSYAEGALNMSIMPRPIVNPSINERIETETRRFQMLAAQEALTSEYALMQSGLTLEQAQALIQQRADAYSLQIDRTALGSQVLAE